MERGGEALDTKRGAQCAGGTQAALCGSGEDVWLGTAGGGGVPAV